MCKYRALIKLRNSVNFYFLSFVWFFTIPRPRDEKISNWIVQVTLKDIQDAFIEKASFLTKVFFVDLLLMWNQFICIWNAPWIEMANLLRFFSSVYLFLVWDFCGACRFHEAKLHVGQGRIFSHANPTVWPDRREHHLKKKKHKECKRWWIIVIYCTHSLIWT